MAWYDAVLPNIEVMIASPEGGRCACVDKCKTCFLSHGMIFFLDTTAKPRAVVGIGTRKDPGSKMREVRFVRSNISYLNENLVESDPHSRFLVRGLAMLDFTVRV